MVKCQSLNCHKTASVGLDCPNCKKLGIPSYFCSNECFRTNYNTHKVIHAFAKKNLLDQLANNSKNPAVNADGTENPFPDFQFTGQMRPHYPLSPYREVPADIPRTDYADDPQGIPKSSRKQYSNSIPILEGDDLEAMRKSCRLGREVLEIAKAAAKPGMTTDELDEIVHNAIIARKSYPSPLNYRKFPKSVCLSLNEVICHGIPDKRKLVDGDILNIDIGLYHQGFHADLSATIAIGAISSHAQKLMDTTRACLDAAIAICKPGVPFRNIGDIIQPIAEKEGFGVIRYYTGHGVGREFHCAPNIVHAKNRAVGTMKKGMVFTIEPMINGNMNHNLIHWPDDWTTTTTDGALSAQYEETILITEDGYEILTA